MTIDELEKLKLLAGATPPHGESCGECGAPAVALIHKDPGHSSVCATHLEPYAAEDVCDCYPITGKCLHHRRDASGICLACGPAEAANDERYRRDEERMQAKRAIERMQWVIQCLEKLQFESCDDKEGLHRCAAAYAKDAGIILMGGVDENLNRPPAWFKPPVGASRYRDMEVIAAGKELRHAQEVFYRHTGGESYTRSLEALELARKRARRAWSLYRHTPLGT
jgi:hypothetical protein